MNKLQRCWACGTILEKVPDEIGYLYCPNEMCLMDEHVEIEVDCTNCPYEDRKDEPNTPCKDCKDKKLDEQFEKR